MTSNTRTADALDQLATGIGRLTDSAQWRDWLVMQSRFHRYSFGNTLLIQLQTGGSATRVAGFHAWRKLGRNVRKGEQAIWILAPMTRKIETEDSREPDRVLLGFKAAPVFDLAQTDGEPLPEITTPLSGSGPAGVYDDLRWVARQLGYPVQEEEIAGPAHGYCDFAKHEIHVEATNDETQRIKTLVHECGHAILHEDFDGSRELAELEAESVAFIVCSNLGIRSDEYSFGYVTVWSGGGDEAIAAIKASGARIQRAAEAILSSLDASPAD